LTRPQQHIAKGKHGARRIGIWGTFENGLDDVVALMPYWRIGDDRKQAKRRRDLFTLRG
jgi:hypothetical protein